MLTDRLVQFYHCLVGLSFVFLQNSLTSSLHHFIDPIFKCIRNSTASHKPLFQPGPSTTISCLCGYPSFLNGPQTWNSSCHFPAQNPPRGFLPRRPGSYLQHAGSSRHVSSVQFSSVTQSCPTLCDPMDCNTPGLPVHHQLPEFTQTHVHWVSDAIQPSHPLSSPSPPAFNLSQHQGLFKWPFHLSRQTQLWHVGSSSLTREGIRSVES